MLISFSQSHLFAFLFSFLYVGSIYASKTTRLSFNSSSSSLGRNDPSVIKARLTAVTIATLLSLAIVYLVCGEDDESLRLLGLSGGMMVLTPHLITPLLFLGPMYQYYHSIWSGEYQSESISSLIGSWMGLRNYIFAPISEELVFRSCVLAVYLSADNGTVSRNTLMWCSPWCFGLAHVHHAYEQYHQMGKTRRALKIAIASSSFQFVYTTLFGLHSAFLFLRSGSIYPSITAHIFCNFMGLPPIDSSLLKRKGLMVLYVVGIGLYVYGMRRWSLTRETFWR